MCIYIHVCICIFSMCLYMIECFYVHCMNFWVPWNIEYDVSSRETGVIEGCE